MALSLINQVSTDEALKAAAFFTLGSASAIAALTALGYLPLYFGPEQRSWGRDYWDADACALLDAWDRDSSYSLYRAMESNRNYLYMEPDTARRVRKVLYFNRKRSLLVGVVKFGADCEGPPRCVHGGCTAAVIDAVMGVAAYRTARMPCVTASLTVDYKAKIPLGTCVRVNVQHVETDGRKSRFEATLSSLDGASTYSTAQGLFINAVVPGGKNMVPAFLKM